MHADSTYYDNEARSYEDTNEWMMSGLQEAHEGSHT